MLGGYRRFYAVCLSVEGDVPRMCYGWTAGPTLFIRKVTLQDRHLRPVGNKHAERQTADENAIRKPRRRQGSRQPQKTQRRGEATLVGDGVSQKRLGRGSRMPTSRRSPSQRAPTQRVAPCRASMCHRLPLVRGPCRCSRCESAANERYDFFLRERRLGLGLWPGAACCLTLVPAEAAPYPIGGNSETKITYVTCVWQCL